MNIALYLYNNHYTNHYAKSKFHSMVKLSPGTRMYFHTIDFSKDESNLANNTFLQNHATRFMEAIDVIIRHDMDINMIGSYLRAVGSKHHSYNLKIEHVQVRYFMIINDYKGIKVYINRKFYNKNQVVLNFFVISGKFDI